MGSKAVTILVVDDEASIRRLISGLLRAKGFPVMEAGNGLEAVHVYASYHSRIGLVITDLDMPVMNGCEAIERIRAIEPDARILVVSSNAGGEAMSLPELKHLTKPFSLAALLEAVESLITQCR